MSDLVREYRETMHAGVLRLWARDAVAELSRLSALVAEWQKAAEPFAAYGRVCFSAVNISDEHIEIAVYTDEGDFEITAGDFRRLSQLKDTTNADK